MKENKDIQPVEDIKDTSLFVEDGEDVFKDYEQKFEASGEDNREYDNIDSVEAYTEPVLENLPKALMRIALKASQKIY